MPGDNVTIGTTKVAQLVLQYAKLANLPHDEQRAKEWLGNKNGRTLPQPAAPLLSLSETGSTTSVGRAPVSPVLPRPDSTLADPKQPAKQGELFASSRISGNKKIEKPGSRPEVPLLSDSQRNIGTQNVVAPSRQVRGSDEKTRQSNVERLYGNLSYTFKPKFADGTNEPHASSDKKSDSSVSVDVKNLADKSSFLKDLNERIQKYKEITGSIHSQEVVAMTSLHAEVGKSDGQKELIASAKRYVLLSQIFDVLAVQLHIGNLSLCDPKSRLAAQAKTLRGAAIKERNVDVLSKLLDEARIFARHFEEECNTPLDGRWKADGSLNVENRARKLEKLKQWGSMTPREKANHLAEKIRPRIDQFNKVIGDRLANMNATQRPEARGRLLKEGVIEAQRIYNNLVYLSGHNATSDTEILDVLNQIHTISHLSEKDSGDDSGYEHAVLGPHVVSDALLYRNNLSATTTAAAKSQVPMPPGQEASVEQKALFAYQGLEKLQEKANERGNDILTKIPDFDETRLAILLARVKQLINSQQVEGPDLRYLEEAQKLAAAFYASRG